VTAPKELLERIQLRLEDSFTGIGEVVGDMPAADVADLVNQLTIVEAATILTMLPVARAVQVFDQPTMGRRAPILENLPAARAAQILEGMAADERTDLVQHLGERDRRKLLPTLKPEVRAEVERLCQYPDHSAGGIMTTEFVRLEPSMKVGEALKHIRAVAREKESIYACYVLEPGTGRLQGSLSLRDLVMAEMDRPIVEVMRRKPITVDALDDQESVANKIAKYNLLAVPVLEKDGSVVGFVTVDDVIDVLIEEGTEDILRLAGVEPGALDKPYFDNPVWLVVRKRIGWLLLLFVAETFTGTVLRHFENELADVVALSFFIPLLIGTGGNIGSQTVTLIVRAMALNEVAFRDVAWIAFKEMRVGLILGAIMAVIAFGRAWLLGVGYDIGFVVSITILAICLWSATVAAVLPLVLRRLRVDPAVVSAPLITTLVDGTGLIIYFEIAKFVLRL
jgi:magnesium transporter